jgi:integrase
VATPGDGRHTFASLLANAGEPLIYISGQLGHTMTQTTQRYSHALDPARLQRSVPMETAILAARRDLAAEDVQEMRNGRGGLAVAAR